VFRGGVRTDPLAHSDPLDSFWDWRTLWS